VPTHHTFVFIGGLHRSGTTLLARQLADHPVASGFENSGASEEEGQWLQAVYPPALRFGGPGRFGFASTMHLTDSSSLVTQANRDQLMSEWSRHWDCERPVLIEKSPPNLLKTRFLQAMFPRARFIMVLRHPLANALATQKMSGRRLHVLIEHWFACYNTLVQDLAFLDHVTFLRYEDLVLRTDEELMRLHRFIGVEPMRSRLEPRQGVNEDYFKHWYTNPEIGGSRGFERCLPRSVRTRLLERSFETRANAFGYSMREPTRIVDRDHFLSRFVPAGDEDRARPISEITLCWPSASWVVPGV
jgi:adenylate kinase family enzyme